MTDRAIPGSSPPLALQTRDLGRQYGPVIAAEGVNLSVAPGETLALLGPSGSGKSTVLRLIAGLERPDAGQVMVSGREVTSLPPEARHLGLVFQDYALFPHLNVLGNVAYGPRRRGAARIQAEQQAREALQLVGLEALERRRTSELSGGQQQRVALARALAPGPPLLLLDEPLSNLDEQLRARLREDLRSLFGRLGTAVVIVTHDQREALALADRVALMRAGRVVQLGAAAEVFAAPVSAWAAEFLGQPNVFALPGQPGRAVMVPEQAVRLGEGPRWPVISRQRSERGQTLKVAHPLGDLTLHLSAREAAAFSGPELALDLDDAGLRELPDDRQQGGGQGTGPAGLTPL
ncbi:ABC transporter ATP-binding protein [Deinococcus irradiatisoli]|uniref:ABC transporter ATP-binding protein n=1 Tax=Deinococcus irradiatisoli TaxID=2202254 RepID=A0A2Z3JCD4_9DEIO|nr:ABC transporter ATP-binding protein [Deinococcus irradiatisoli]AWN22702.1 ABC transporter ATP-binding protein [Deinococcus irradiatisoli]